MQAILADCAAGELDAQVTIVVSDRRDSEALDQAESAGIAALYHPLQWYVDTGRTREDYDLALIDLITPYEPDWIVLAGWPHDLSAPFLRRYSGRVISARPGESLVERIGSAPGGR